MQNPKRPKGAFRFLEAFKWDLMELYICDLRGVLRDLRGPMRPYEKPK